MATMSKKDEKINQLLDENEHMLEELNLAIYILHQLDPSKTRVEWVNYLYEEATKIIKSWKEKENA